MEVNNNNQCKFKSGRQHKQPVSANNNKSNVWKAAATTNLSQQWEVQIKKSQSKGLSLSQQWEVKDLEGNSNNHDKFRAGRQQKATMTSLGLEEQQWPD